MTGCSPVAVILELGLGTRWCRTSGQDWTQTWGDVSGAFDAAAQAVLTVEGPATTSAALDVQTAAAVEFPGQAVSENASEEPSARRHPRALPAPGCPRVPSRSMPVAFS